MDDFDNIWNTEIIQLVVFCNRLFSPCYALWQFLDVNSKTYSITIHDYVTYVCFSPTQHVSTHRFWSEVVSYGKLETFFLSEFFDFRMSKWPTAVHYVSQATQRLNCYLWDHPECLTFSIAKSKSWNGLWILGKSFRPFARTQTFNCRFHLWYSTGQFQ